METKEEVIKRLRGREAFQQWASKDFEVNTELDVFVVATVQKAILDTVLDVLIINDIPISEYLEG
jgi:hypothetical protein